MVIVASGREAVGGGEVGSEERITRAYSTTSKVRK